MKNLELGELQRPSDAASAAEEKNGGMENVDDVLGRLTFMRKGREMLGSVNFGASYKAALSTGPTVVVKKFKEMNAVDMEDFTEHMWRLGRLSHPNILPLLAYYYKNRAELLVFDFVANGSLAHLLHGKRGSVMPPLDWPTRLKIVKGVARGLAYLYNELPVLSLPHGHFKSSNVLLNETFEPLLTDYAVVPVANAASQLMVAYKSPEANEFGRPSNKSDVWSLGILILEILTRKYPGNFLPKKKYPGNFLQKRTTAQSWQHGWAW